ncbi:hypothetical protein BH10CYA1_BH10CYA1_18480 [soil metagenome]
MADIIDTKAEGANVADKVRHGNLTGAIQEIQADLSNLPKQNYKDQVKALTDELVKDGGLPLIQFEFSSQVKLDKIDRDTLTKLEQTTNDPVAAALADVLLSKWNDLHTPDGSIVFRNADQKITGFVDNNGKIFDIDPNSSQVTKPDGTTLVINSNGLVQASVGANGQTTFFQWNSDNALTDYYQDGRHWQLDTWDWGMPGSARGKLVPVDGNTGEWIDSINVNTLDGTILKNFSNGTQETDTLCGQPLKLPNGIECTYTSGHLNTVVIPGDGDAAQRTLTYDSATKSFKNGNGFVVANDVIIDPDSQKITVTLTSDHSQQATLEQPISGGILRFRSDNGAQECHYPDGAWCSASDGNLLYPNEIHLANGTFIKQGFVNNVWSISEVDLPGGRKISYDTTKSAFFYCDEGGKELYQVPQPVLPGYSSSDYQPADLGYKIGDTTYSIFLADSGYQLAHVDGSSGVYSHDNQLRIGYIDDKNFALPDGKVVHLDGLQWKDSTGTVMADYLLMSRTGTVILGQKNGTNVDINEYLPDGRVLHSTSTPKLAGNSHGGDDELKAMAAAIVADKSKLLPILTDLPAADKLALDAYVYDLTKSSGTPQHLLNIVESMGALDKAHGEALLLRIDDNKPDNVGQLHRLVELLKNGGTDSSNAEKQLIDLLFMNKKSDIDQMLADFRSIYGNDALAAFSANPYVSDGFKQALPILLSGVENNLTETDPQHNDKRFLNEKTFNTLEKLALDTNNIQLLTKAFAYATDAERAQFNNQSFLASLSIHFSGSDLTLAQAVVKEGFVPINVIVSGDTRWLYIDKDLIIRSLQSSDQGAAYLAGKTLAIQNGWFDGSGQNWKVNKPDEQTLAKLPSDQQAEARLFFDTIQSFRRASYNENSPDFVDDTHWNDVALYEDSLINHKRTLISDVVSEFVPYTLGIGGLHYDTNLVMSKLENMSKEDWQRLTDKTSPLYDPHYYEQLREALHTFLSIDDMKIAERILNKKMAATSYETSILTGNRTLLEIVSENRINSNQPKSIIDYLEHLPYSEIVKYRDALRAQQAGDQSNEALFQVQYQLAQMNSPERELAQYIFNRIATLSDADLQKLSTGLTSPSMLNVDSYHQLKIDSFMAMSPSFIIADAQSTLQEKYVPTGDNDPLKKFAGQTYLQIIQNIPTGSDAETQARITLRAELKGIIVDAYQHGADDNIFKFAFDNINHSTNDLVEKILTTDGNFPLDMRLGACTDSLSKITAILTTSQSDRIHLLSNLPADKSFQDAVFANLTPAQIELTKKNLLEHITEPQPGSDGELLSNVETVRLFTLGVAGSSDQIITLLHTLSDADKLTLILNYNASFNIDGHHDAISDLVSKAGADKDRMTDALHLNPLNAQQLYYDSSFQSFLKQVGLAPLNSATLNLESARDTFQHDLTASNASGKPLSADKLKQDLDNLQQAEKAYTDAKKAFTDTVMLIAITAGSMLLGPEVGAAVKALFAAGEGATALALIGAVGLVGAGAEVLGKSAGYGYDYDWSAQNVLSDAVRGAVSSAGMVFGPMLAQKVLGELVLANLARTSNLASIPGFTDMIEQLGGKFSQGAIDEQLPGFVRTIASGGDAVQAARNMMRSALFSDIPGDVALSARQEAVLSFFVQKVLTNTTNVFNYAGYKFVASVAAAEITGVTAQAFAAGASRVINWDPNKTTGDNFTDAVKAAGDTIGPTAVSIFAFSLGSEAIGALIKVPGQLFEKFRNTTNHDVVIVVDGQSTTVPAGKDLLLQPTQQLALPPGTTSELITADPTKAIATTGDTTVIKPTTGPITPAGGVPFLAALPTSDVDSSSQAGDDSKIAKTGLNTIVDEFPVKSDTTGIEFRINPTIADNPIATKTVNDVSAFLQNLLPGEAELLKKTGIKFAIIASAADVPELAQMDVPGQPGKKFGDPDVLAFYDSKTNTVYLKPGADTNSIPHEFAGHGLDHALGNFSQTALYDATYQGDAMAHPTSTGYGDLYNSAGAAETFADIAVGVTDAVKTGEFSLKFLQTMEDYPGTTKLVIAKLFDSGVLTPANLTTLKTLCAPDAIDNLMVTGILSQAQGAALKAEDALPTLLKGLADVESGKYHNLLLPENNPPGADFPTVGAENPDKAVGKINIRGTIDTGLSLIWSDGTGKELGHIDMTASAMKDPVRTIQRLAELDYFGPALADGLERVTAAVIKKTWVMKDLHVDEGAREQGVASAMIKASFDQARANGVTFISGLFTVEGMTAVKNYCKNRGIPFFTLRDRVATYGEAIIYIGDLPVPGTDVSIPKISPALAPTKGLGSDAPAVVVVNSGQSYATIPGETVYASDNSLVIAGPDSKTIGMPYSEIDAGAGSLVSVGDNAKVLAGPQSLTLVYGDSTVDAQPGADVVIRSSGVSDNFNGVAADSTITVDTPTVNQNHVHLQTGARAFVFAPSVTVDAEPGSTVVQFLKPGDMPVQYPSGVHVVTLQFDPHAAYGENFAEFAKVITKLPTEILDWIQKEGISIALAKSAGDLMGDPNLDSQPFPNTSNMTYADAGAWYHSDQQHPQLAFFKSTNILTVLEELSHAIEDRILGDSSQTALFQNIVRLEAMNIPPGIFDSDSPDYSSEIAEEFHYRLPTGKIWDAQTPDSLEAACREAYAAAEMCLWQAELGIPLTPGQIKFAHAVPDVMKYVYNDMKNPSNPLLPAQDNLAVQNLVKLWSQTP